MFIRIRQRSLYVVANKCTVLYPSENFPYRQICVVVSIDLGSFGISNCIVFGEISTGADIWSCGAPGVVSEYSLGHKFLILWLEHLSIFRHRRYLYEQTIDVRKLNSSSLSEHLCISLHSSLLYTVTTV